MKKEVREYDNQIDTAVRALDAIYGCPRGIRALSRLNAKWPEISWPPRLAEIFCAVLFEPPPLALPAPNSSLVTGHSSLPL